jgi:hypothetical protein
MEAQDLVHHRRGGLLESQAPFMGLGQRRMGRKGRKYGDRRANAQFPQKHDATSQMPDGGIPRPFFRFLAGI